jgi:hypothetical protein
MATYKKWNQSELQFINDNISTSSDHEIASKLSQITGSNITYGMIRRQRRKLGVVKQRGRPRKNKSVVSNS